MGKTTSRRSVLKFGIASSLASTVSGLFYQDADAAKGNDRTGNLGSTANRNPYTTPFVEPLPIPPVKQPVKALHPPPSRLAGAEEAGRAPHQAWDDYPVPEGNYYELRVQEAYHSFHPELPTQKIWGYDGILPGPTFVVHYASEIDNRPEKGKPSNPYLVRIYNDLPKEHVGFGTPEIITHVHNSHTPAESDGFPTHFYSRWKKGPGLTRPGHYLDHHIPNIRSYRINNGERHASTLGTLWYHDHCDGFTAANVYAGLAGFWILFDEIDTGNENDPNRDNPDVDRRALCLPSGLGKYDIPLVIQDKSFDSSGYLFFDQMDTEGKVGNKFCVNGKIQPYFEVERRKYRFRLLNGSTLRFYEFYLVHQGREQAFFHISNDGNLLPAPLVTNKIALGNAERGDIVIDFSKYPLGSRLYMVNRLEQRDGRGPTGKLMRPGDEILRFDVVREPAYPDNSRVPPQLRRIPSIEELDLSRVKRVRHWKFDRRNGQWTINNQLWNSESPTATIKRGEDEIWVFKTSGGWAHPVHIHMEEARILTRNGKRPPLHEQGRKDVYTLYDGDEISILLSFDDFTGDYVMHCHNSVHEDHHMMTFFRIVP